VTIAELFDAAMSAQADLPAREQEAVAAERAAAALRAAVGTARKAADAAVQKLARVTGVLDTSVVFERAGQLYVFDKSDAAGWRVVPVKTVRKLDPAEGECPPPATPGEPPATPGEPPCPTTSPSA